MSHYSRSSIVYLLMNFYMFEYIFELYFFTCLVLVEYGLLNILQIWGQCPVGSYSCLHATLECIIIL